jgi:hypothetical protein
VGQAAHPPRSGQSRYPYCGAGQGVDCLTPSGSNPVVATRGGYTRHEQFGPTGRGIERGTLKKLIWATWFVKVAANSVEQDRAPIDGVPVNAHAEATAAAAVGRLIRKTNIAPTTHRPPEIMVAIV